MRCPNCQHQNSETAKFCENCGYNLRAAPPPAQPPMRRDTPPADSPRATPPSPPTDPGLERLQKLVPREFARRLLDSRSGRVERERRVVTILFSDVKGSTALGDERDPEEVLEIMNGALDLLIEPVYRYEGTLARLMGDAILAFFGAPIAHEDDPERACLAALAMQHSIQQYAAELKRTRGLDQFAVRVGINTGLVVVGEVGSDLRVEYTAMGDAINVASRLENAAEPGSIVISETTARLVQHALALESLGALALKGKTEPVNAYRVLGRQAAPTSARGIAGLTSPLVGRERELAALQRAVENLIQGNGGIVALTGEAGLGKSRLIAELRKSQSADGTSPMADGESPISHLQLPVRWLEGRSLSYESNTPNAPFMDMLGRFFEFAPDDTDLERYDQLHARIQAILPGRADETAPFIATLLGIELTGEPLERIRYMMPPMLRGEIVKNLIALIGALAVDKPTVLVFEDVHWTDASSLELIGALASLVTHVPLLIVILLRPNKTDPAWQLHESLAAQYPAQHTTIALEPLNERDSRQLVANLLEIEDLPESIRALILAKAEGNPFFVEEVIRSLLDQKLVVSEVNLADGLPHWRATREIANIAIPDTLAGVITARLDRLDEEGKHTAQTAAVIGRNFRFDVLAEVSDEPQALEPSLALLQTRELVRQRTDDPGRAYLFKHALTQETAYNTLLKSKRTVLHKRVGETLERLAPQSVDDIARHFSEAGETRRAVPYLLAAGDRAIRSFAIAEALSYYSRAAETAKTGDNLTLTRRAYEGLGNALTFANELERALELYREMFEFGKAHDDIPMQVSALNKTASIVGMRQGQFPAAEEWVKQAETLAEQVGDKLGLAEAYTIRCMLCMTQADFDGTIRYMEQSVDIGRELNVKEQMAFGLTHITSARMNMADLEGSFRTAQEGMAIALEIGDREHEAELCLDGFGLYHWLHGEVAEAIRYIERGLEISAKINAVNNLIFGNYYRAWIAVECGDYETALAALERSIAAAAPMEEFMPFMLTIPVAARCHTYTQISPALWDKARPDYERALAMLETPTGLPGGGSAFPDLGFSALRRGELVTARELFTRGLDSPSIMRIVMRPRSLCGMASALLAAGKLDQAVPYLREAREFIQAHGIQNLEPPVALTEAQVSAAQGETERALKEYARAEFYGLEIGLLPYVWQARAGAARLLEALGRTAEAADKRAGAQAVIDERAARLNDLELRDLFVAAAQSQLDAIHIQSQ